jgi:hypothetical protein
VLHRGHAGQPLLLQRGVVEAVERHHQRLPAAAGRRRVGHPGSAWGGRIETGAERRGGGCGVGFGPGRGFAVSEGRGLQLVSEWLLGSGSGSSQLLQRPSLPVLALIRTVHPHQGAGPQLFLPFLRLLVLDPSLRVSLCDPRRPAALPPTATSGAAPCSDRRRSPQRSLPTALDLPPTATPNRCRWPTSVSPNSCRWRSPTTLICGASSDGELLRSPATVKLMVRDGIFYY